MNSPDYLVHPPKDKSHLQASISQPLCIAIQVAMFNLLQRWGVRPDVVLGHSSGEIAAAYASGAISMEDAIKLSYRRGQSLPDNSRGGGMAVVGLSWSDVTRYLRKGVTVGCENSPSNVTLSGDRNILEEILTVIKMDKPETFIRILNVEMAYHSRKFDTL
jgi:acyl transferase domain-containing protein